MPRFFAFYRDVEGAAFFDPVAVAQLLDHCRDIYILLANYTFLENWACFIGNNICCFDGWDGILSSRSWAKNCFCSRFKIR